MRLFAAIELDEPFRKRLVDLQDALQRTAPDIAYTRPQNLHLTLKFIGEFEEARVPQLCQSLGDLPKVGEFKLSLKGLDFLPERGPIRIIGAAVDGGEALLALATQIEDACAREGVSRENRRYRPHITLARARRPLPRSAKAKLAICAVAPVDFLVDKFVLMQSKLSSKGSQYLPLHHVHL